MKSTHGGKRAGAGKPKGVRWAATLAKLAMREQIIRRVQAELDPLLDAQFANAKGIKYLIVRQKSSGKFLRVGEAMARLQENEELVEVWEKDPSTPAFTDLMNRAIDKPAEQEQAVAVSGELVISWKT